MNVEIGTEAALFPEKEYINGIFVAVFASSRRVHTALEYSTRVVQEGGRRCKKSTLNDLVHMTPLRIPLMNPPSV